MLTKKHFKVIAHILGDGYGMDQTKFQRLCDRFADFLANENPRFDRAKFIEACWAEQ